MAPSIRYATTVELSLNPTLTPNVNQAVRFQKIPDICTPEWEIWVDAVDTVRGYNENAQHFFAGEILHIARDSRPEQIEALPGLIGTILKTIIFQGKYPWQL